MSLLDRFPHKGTISRLRYERDEYIGNREVAVPLATGVQAWVQNASMSEITEFQKRDMAVTHKAFFLADHGMRPGDLFTVTSGPAFVGDVLKFQAKSDRSAGLGVVHGAMFELERNVQEAFSA
jgi:hypothetical protein